VTDSSCRTPLWQCLGHRLPLFFFARILFLFFLPAIDEAISVRICNHRASSRPDARLPNPNPQQPTIRSKPLGTYLNPPSPPPHKASNYYTYLPTYLPTFHLPWQVQ
jgi:hypothetical protein